MRSNTHVLNQGSERASPDRDAEKNICAVIFHLGLEPKH